MKPGANLGDLIQLFYTEYLALYGDEELASVAAAASINQILEAEVEEEDRETPPNPNSDLESPADPEATPPPGALRPKP